MASGALVTAGVASVLLVVVLGIDATMTTTYAVDVWTGSDWRELARAPVIYSERPHMAPYGGAIVEVNRSDELRFQVRADNGYPWDTTSTFRVHHMGTEVAKGSFDSPARAEGTHEFTLEAEGLLGGSFSPREPVPQQDAPETVPVDLFVEVEGEELYPYFQLREVRS